MLLEWRQSVLARKPPPQPLCRQEVVSSIRALLEQQVAPPDWSLLGATLSLAPPSAPSLHRHSLQNAESLETLWPALVQAVATASDPDDPAAALDSLKERLGSFSSAPGWMRQTRESPPLCHRRRAACTKVDDACASTYWRTPLHIWPMDPSWEVCSGLAFFFVLHSV